MKYETSKYIYDFQKFQVIINFGDNIYNDKMTLSEADEGQKVLSNTILDFYDKAPPKTKSDKEKKNTHENGDAFYEGRELAFNAFKSGIFP